MSLQSVRGSDKKIFKEQKKEETKEIAIEKSDKIERKNNPKNAECPNFF